MKIGSILVWVVLLGALAFVALKIQQAEMAPPPPDNSAMPQVSPAAQAAAEEQYQKANEFRKWAAEHPQQPEAGYATVPPSQQR
ncbi:hypothetical protein PQ455_01320 [Sphingomonas naphthae]|uniref:Uncharacterized protein n=1 Tax=Sphingomonas naphthae TaxID=1813468 RepID=A0ABY7TMB9_9SPHN|nr:hypothetical protein [Sphingomonas naphthae]WCT73901.1 hypothetical protein PQ455_01320 [Sphingomonas naphthae]